MIESPLKPTLEIYLLGLVEFEEVQRLQRRLVYEQGERGGASLILCEHPPTVSIGRSGSRSHLVPDDDTLRSLGIRTYWVNRGGGCILHLPGQLAAYFVAPLQRLGLDVLTYLHQLNVVIIDLLQEFELRGQVYPGHSGVFIDRARVATVGVAVNRWIAYHGLTLNVGAFLEPLQLIDEPGFGTCRLKQTSLQARRQRPTPMSKVRESLICLIESRFELDRHHIYTHHPLVSQKVRAHVHAESS